MWCDVCATQSHDDVDDDELIEGGREQIFHLHASRHQQISHCRRRLQPAGREWERNKIALMSIALIELSELIHLCCTIPIVVLCCCSNSCWDREEARLSRVRVNCVDGEIGFRETIYYFIQLLQLLLCCQERESSASLQLLLIGLGEGEKRKFESSILICKVSVSASLSDSHSFPPLKYCNSKFALSHNSTRFALDMNKTFCQFSFFIFVAGAVVLLLLLVFVWKVTFGIFINNKNHLLVHNRRV